MKHPQKIQPNKKIQPCWALSPGQLRLIPLRKGQRSGKKNRHSDMLQKEVLVFKHKISVTCGWYQS